MAIKVIKKAATYARGVLLNFSSDKRFTAYIKMIQRTKILYRVVARNRRNPKEPNIPLMPPTAE